MPEDNASTQTHRRLSIVGLLEGGDGLAHMLVAALLLLLAIAILASSTYSFVSDIFFKPMGGEFVERALHYLSDLLFGVIVLELLSTILTYIQARNLAATVKDFLVVGLISSVRKILLVGAQSSLHAPKTDEFVQESIGTVITIVGICLLIGGLLFLVRQGKSVDPEGSESE